MAVAGGLWAAAAVGGYAQTADETVFHPYFGDAYEHGSWVFKTTTIYGENTTGFAPFAGVSLSKNFALEMDWRMGYGDGKAVAGSPTTETTSTATIVTSSTTTYHSSSNAFALDLYGYAGAELRVLGRIQNLNMGNTGKYLFTVSAGLSLRI